jgi:hypothetical protein
MLVAADSLTFGQLTFIIRVVVQVLSLVASFLIGLLMLSNSPQIASFRTHDVINRIIGRMTATDSSLAWIWHYSRRPEQSPIKSPGFVLSIALLSLYGLVAKLSDVGFLGFYTCSIPNTDGSKYASPNDIVDDVHAQSVILDNLVDGTDPNTLKAHRCDSSVLISLEQNTTAWSCDTWDNSTWINRSFFSGLNNTDTDMMMPRKLAKSDKMTSFFVDTGSQRVEQTTISGGILVNPHDIGFQALLGVPSLDSGQSFKLDQAMALEVETGCMSLGISSSKAVNSDGSGIEIFSTNGTWRRYSGPDILYEPLLNITDTIRSYWRPLFDESSLDSDGNIFGTNVSTEYTASLTVQGVILPTIEGNQDARSEFYETCTNLVREKIGLSHRNSRMNEEYSCGLLGIGGDVEFAGSIFGAQNYMICASTVQINMVSATVHNHAQEKISLNFTRLPSDLNVLIADYWESRQSSEGEILQKFAPFRRFTLGSNTTGPLLHYIAQYPDRMSTHRAEGVASGGYALARVGSRVLHTDSAQNPDHGGLEELERNAFETILDPTSLTKWSGQIGASYILASLQYNPWVALDQPSIFVTSEASQLAICYHSAYVVGFLPLLVSLLLAVIGGFLAFTRTSFTQLKSLGKLYGGMLPYWSSVSPSIRIKDVFMVWRQEPDTRLDVVGPRKELLLTRRKVPRDGGYLRLDSEHEVGNY